MPGFTETLLAWYKDNARNLPWRTSTDPYTIWVSEVILQQTRVEQGTPYFFRFMKKFPDVLSLANADEQEVLRIWQGLGYYSRARNLHAAARQVREEWQGVFPNRYTDLLLLKGIGPYTAAAIASICSNEQVPVVDGNVYRFISRYLALEIPVPGNAAHKQFSSILQEWMSGESGIFNQALMEFGALFCTPAPPDCGQCPFMASCHARAANRVREFPVRQARAEIKTRWFTYFDFRFGEKWYLTQRLDSGIWKGLWQFPVLESDRQPSKEEIENRIRSLTGLKPEDWTYEGNWSSTHLLSHRRIHARFIRIKLPVPLRKNAIFEKMETDLGELPLPQIMVNYLLSNSNYVSK